MTETSSSFLWIAAFAGASALVNALGILSIIKYKGWAEKSLPYFMCFAAGILISSPLILALPNAVRSNPGAGFTALLGFLVMFFSNKLIKYYTKKRELAFGLVAAEGIGIHSFVDGIIYTVTFSVSILVGFLSAIGLVIHEFAEGVITYIFLLKGGLSKKASAVYAFLIAGLSTPIGAFLVYPFVSRLERATLGLMLGFVAGVLLYVSASHLLPEATVYEKKHSTLAFMAGVGLALFIVFTKSP
ncbi:MAG: ZIP family metal transporter [Desulfobacca sp.]|nr:ZIP family metal transporter [Desulfobacca sp.]